MNRASLPDTRTMHLHDRQQPKPAEPEPKRKSAAEGTRLPRLFGRFWMIRRFTSAQIVPAIAGAGSTNPMGSSHYGNLNDRILIFSQQPNSSHKSSRVNS